MTEIGVGRLLLQYGPNHAKSAAWEMFCEVQRQVEDHLFYHTLSQFTGLAAPVLVAIKTTYGYD